MSQLRVAETDLYQEIEDERLRETLRQLTQNNRNLQTQLDELLTRIEFLESQTND
jgi:predicted nuclease with TOPRIM domain